MKKILIPTDLTALGDFAYDIAKIIAKKMNATIDVLTIISGPQDAVYDDKGNMVENRTLNMKEWEDQRDEAQKKLREWSKGKEHVASLLAKIGRIESGIIHYAKSNNIDLIVMGTEGAMGVKGFILGSHADHIIRNVPIPVLSLKCDRSDLSLDEMVFVSDFHEKELLDLDLVKEIQKAFDSKLILLNIKTPNNKNTDESIVAEMEDFVKKHNLKNVEYNIYKSNGVETGIGKFSAERDIDLIILGSHQKKGLSRLFTKNISSDVVNHLYHPILTFPIK